MTTPKARYAVYNPHQKPIDALPAIYGLNNGGGPSILHAVAVAEDGTVLGSHRCTHECFMPHDLGVLEGTRLDRHENSYQKHYPDGYRMEFVCRDEVPGHKALQKAIALNREAHNTEDQQ